MDLENFDDILELNARSDPSSEASSSPEIVDSAREVLDHLDEGWYINTTRRARWMDIIGDYAGNELFVLDGQ